MLTFLSAHLKSLVTAGFVLGLIGLVIRYLDYRLSDKTKQAVGKWIEDKTLRVDAITIRAIYRVISKTSWKVPTILCALLVGVLYFANGTEQLAEYSAVLSVIVWLLYGGLKFLFRDPDLDSAFDSAIGQAVYLFGFALIVAVGSWFQHFLQYGDDNEVSEFTEALAPAFMALSCMLPFILLALLKVPLLWASKLMWRIASDPKGPWNGFVAVSTIGLMVLRLFM